MKWDNGTSFTRLKVSSRAAATGRPLVRLRVRYPRAKGPSVKPGATSSAVHGKSR